MSVGNVNRRPTQAAREEGGQGPIRMDQLEGKMLRSSPSSASRLGSKTLAPE